MRDYYAMETKNVRGYTINLDEFKQISLYDYFLKNIAKNRNINFDNMSEEEKNTVNMYTPTFLILEKINDEFYEVYTKTQLVSEKNYKNGEGLLYVNKNYGWDTREPLSLKDMQLDKYVEDWNLNTDECVKILQSFVNDCRLYSSTSEEFKNKKKLNFEMQEKKNEESTKVINDFEESVNSFPKTR
jgi:hypothetical protein